MNNFRLLGIRQNDNKDSLDLEEWRKPLLATLVLDLFFVWLFLLEKALHRLCAGLVL